MSQKQRVSKSLPIEAFWATLGDTQFPLKGNKAMINWVTGKITRPEKKASGPLWSLISAGDWAAVGGFAEEMLRDPKAPYGELLAVIRGADLAMVNLETVLSERGTPIIKEGPNLRGPIQAITSLVEAGFHVVSLANNHMRDYGREALEDTLNLCRDAGIQTVGAGLTLEEAWAPAWVEIKGLRVAILALAEHEEAAFWPGMDCGVAAWDIARAVEAIRKAKEEADVVIYQCHVGTEFNPLPAPRLSEAFHRLIDAGASLVIGHHPHVPMGLEEYKEGLIAYSLGNFLFDFRDYVTPARVHEGYLLGVDFQGAEIIGGQLYPYRAVNGHHLTWLREEEAQDLLSHLERISRPLGDSELLREYWNAFCDELYPHRWARKLPAFVAALIGDDPEARIRKGAQHLRNLLRCEAHWDTLQTALDRIVEGQFGRSRPEVVAEVRALNPWIADETA